jgi:hypothetical protein
VERDLFALLAAFLLPFFFVLSDKSLFVGN